MIMGRSGRAREAKVTPCGQPQWCKKSNERLSSVAFRGFFFFLDLNVMLNGRGCSIKHISKKSQIARKGNEAFVAVYNDKWTAKMLGCEPVIFCPVCWVEREKEKAKTNKTKKQKTITLNQHLLLRADKRDTSVAWQPL